MARIKATLGSGVRLADYLSASLLARVVTPDVVTNVLNAHNCNSKRIRSFPALTGVYYCMALSLYPEAAYEEVFNVVASGLSWGSNKPGPPTVAKSSISALRTKIGSKPLADLVQQCCKPLAMPSTHPQAFFAGLRVVAIDGSCQEVPDEAPNIQEFGHPGSRTGHASYPQARCAILVECATHAILAANIDRYRASEWSVCEPLIAQMDSTMLCLADRGFDGYEYWRQAKSTGAQLLWRCINNRQLPVVQHLPDGSFLSVIHPGKKAPLFVADPSNPAVDPRQPITVRVIEYGLEGVSGGQQAYRLLTTILDPATATATELAALYAQRWQVESVFDELKTHLHQSRRVLRSKKPDLVRQEFYGWVLAHYCVRWLLDLGAQRHGGDHGRQSFTAHVKTLRRTLPESGAFSPAEASFA
jgi:hypothetical protein